MAIPQISRSTKIILVAEFILLAYMLYVLATSLYKSYQVDRFMKQAELENTRLASENESLAEDYEYYRSDAYKEKIAKQNFGLIRPGEEVIILSPNDKPYLTGEEQAVAANQASYQSLSNFQKWLKFFFERERF